MTKPLSDLKVLDLSRVLAGPYCTMLMADMGADVVKIERQGAGDDTRGYGPPFINGESTYYLSVNRNKRSMTLDMKHPKGKEILGEMIDRADVLVENFRPGTLEKLGFGYEAARARNPRLVYCSISGYGHTGPSAGFPGYDLVVQGEGGIADLTGEPDGPPMKVGTSQADIVAGMNAFSGILLALLARGKTGEGQKIDIGLLDCQVSLLTYQAGIYFATGESPKRMGNRHPSIAPYETFQSSDGYVNLGCGNEAIWRRFCTAAGVPDLAEDPRFATNADRVAHRAALLEVMEPMMASRTTSEWVDLLRPGGIPAGPIHSVREVLEHPQTHARDMVIEIDHPLAGPIRLTGIPIKLSETPGEIHSPPPLLGQHTAEVLVQWLGLGPEEIKRLATSGVV
ncbi:MAG TPA: CoA transferase [Anaerolineales bacterium]|nr:CoA transferase [Anaerolineales bacterium]